MAAVGLVSAGEDGIYHAERRVPADPPRRDALTFANPVPVGRVLERAHHRGADRDDAPTVLEGTSDGAHGVVRNPVRLVERQTRVELRVSGR